MVGALAAIGATGVAVADVGAMAAATEEAAMPALVIAPSALVRALALVVAMGLWATRRHMQALAAPEAKWVVTRAPVVPTVT